MEGSDDFEIEIDCFVGFANNVDQYAAKLLYEDHNRGLLLPVWFLNTESIILHELAGLDDEIVALCNSDATSASELVDLFIGLECHLLFWYQRLCAVCTPYVHPTYVPI